MMNIPAPDTFENTIPATVETIQRMLDSYAGTQHVPHLYDAEVEEDEFEDSFSILLRINASEVECYVEHDATLGDVRRAIIDELEEGEYYEFEDFDTVEDLQHKDRAQQKFMELAKVFRQHAQMATGAEGISLQDRIEKDFETMYSKKSSGVPNDAALTEDSVTRLIEDHDLSHGNFEYDEYDGEITVIVEAPNHTTFSIYHNPEEHGDTIGDFRKRFVEQIDEFNAEEEYEELWSLDFGNHNGFTADSFYVLLHVAGLFFEKVAEDMTDDFNKFNA